MIRSAVFHTSHIYILHCAPILGQRLDMHVQTLACRVMYIYIYIYMCVCVCVCCVCVVCVLCVCLCAYVCMYVCTKEGREGGRKVKEGRRRCNLRVVHNKFNKRAQSFLANFRKDCAPSLYLLCTTRMNTSLLIGCIPSFLPSFLRLPSPICMYVCIYMYV